MIPTAFLRERQVRQGRDTVMIDYVFLSANGVWESHILLVSVRY